MVAECIRLAGVECAYYSTPAAHISNKVIFVTYGFEYYPRVMTVRFLNTILTPYNNGNEDSFDDWRKHYLGNLKIQTPNDITYNDWAHHVVKSLRHVGKYYPYNGILSTLTTENSVNGKEFYELPLPNLLNDLEGTMNILESWTAVSWSSTAKTFYTNFLLHETRRLNPWLSEYDRVKIEAETNNLYPEIQHVKSY